MKTLARDAILRYLVLFNCGTLVAGFSRCLLDICPRNPPALTNPPTHTQPMLGGYISSERVGSSVVLGTQAD